MDTSVRLHIATRPGVCGGKPCIAGTRIRVQDIYVWHELEAFAPDEIVARFPQISLADVYAALAFYWDHRQEIMKDLEREEQLAATMKEGQPSKLFRGVAGRSTHGDSIPPR